MSFPAWSAQWANWEHPGYSDIWDVCLFFFPFSSSSSSPSPHFHFLLPFRSSWVICNGFPGFPLEWMRLSHQGRNARVPTVPTWKEHHRYDAGQKWHVLRAALYLQVPACILLRQSYDVLTIVGMLRHIGPFQHICSCHITDYKLITKDMIYR